MARLDVDTKVIKFLVVSIIGIVSAAATAGWSVSQYMGGYDRTLVSLRDELTLFQYRIGRDEKQNAEAISDQRVRLNRLDQEVNKIEMEIDRDNQRDRELMQQQPKKKYHEGGSP